MIIDRINSLPRVLGVGCPMVDLTVRYDAHEIPPNLDINRSWDEITPEELTALTKDRTLLRTAAGSVPNTIFGLSQMGLPASFIGVVGREEFGDFFANVCDASSDGNFLHRHPSLPTGLCAAFVLPDGQRILRSYVGAAATLREDQLNPDDFEKFNHVHVDGYYLSNKPLIEAIMRLAKSKGLTVSLDLHATPLIASSLYYLPELLEKYVDVVFGNEEEIKAYARDGTVETALTELRRLCSVAAVKLGANGAIVADAHRRFSIDAVPVTAIDTTGAGDSWQAGFLHAYLRGKPLPFCGRVGSLVAGEIVQILGANPDRPTWQRLKEKIQVKENDAQPEISIWTSADPTTNELKLKLKEAGILEFCVEGHDRSGKSPFIDGLEKSLNQEGIRTLTFAPFTAANNQRFKAYALAQGLDISEMSPLEKTSCILANKLDVYNDWKDSHQATIAVQFLRDLINDNRRQALREGVHVILYDRHWMTVQVALTEFQPDMTAIWDDFIPTFFLHVPPHHSGASVNWDSRYEPTSNYARITYYYDLYLSLLQKYLGIMFDHFELITTPLDDAVTKQKKAITHEQVQARKNSETHS